MRQLSIDQFENEGRRVMGAAESATRGGRTPIFERHSMDPGSVHKVRPLRLPGCYLPLLNGASLLLLPGSVHCPFLGHIAPVTLLCRWCCGSCSTRGSGKRRRTAPSSWTRSRSPASATMWSASSSRNPPCCTCEVRRPSDDGWFCLLLQPDMWCSLSLMEHSNQEMMSL